MTDAPRFNFGKNWQSFINSVDGEQLSNARTALSDLLGKESLAGNSFLDAGCGSGIVSLAAQHLGTERIHSFDYDNGSVEATRSLVEMAKSGSEWTIEQGSLTDDEYLAKLGRFDIVYSWGVIHHTGAMWKVAGALPTLVNPGGQLVVAIYNDQGPLSTFWRMTKRIYIGSPAAVQFAIAASYFIPTSFARVIKNLVKLRGISGNRPRGMSAWHDAVDWVGGYPFEVASRETVVEFFEAEGFSAEKIISVGSRQGCNQYVFRAPAHR